MTVAVKNMDMSGPRRVEVKAQSGVRICGSGNILLTGKRDPASASGGANAKTEAERNDKEARNECEVQKYTKLQAESVRREIEKQFGTEQMLTWV